MDTSLDSGWRHTPLGPILYLAQLYLIPYIGSTLGDLHNIGLEGLRILGVSKVDIKDIQDACQTKAKHNLPDYCMDNLRDDLKHKAATQPRPQKPKTFQPQKFVPVSTPLPTKPLVRNQRSRPPTRRAASQSEKRSKPPWQR